MSSNQQRTSSLGFTDLSTDPTPSHQPHPRSLSVRYLRELAAQSTDLATRCRCLLRYISRQQGKLVYGFSPQALAEISRYSWSDDLCDLEQVITAAVERCQGKVILPAHLPPLGDRTLPTSHALPPVKSADDGVSGTETTNPSVNQRGPLTKTEQIGQHVKMAPSEQSITVTSSPSQFLPLVDVEFISAKPYQKSAVVFREDDTRASASRHFEYQRALEPAAQHGSSPQGSLNTVGRAAGKLEDPHGPDKQAVNMSPIPSSQPPPRIRPLREVLEEAERRHISQALNVTGHDLSRAADLLQIPRQTLQYRMKVLGLDVSPKPLA